MSSSSPTLCIAGITACALGALGLWKLAQNAQLSATSDARVMQRKRADHQDPAGCSRLSTVTNKQGLELFVRHWDPKAGSRVRAVVLVVHGYTWTSRYYDKLAAHLNPQGVEVVAYDHQGNGLSDAARGVRGYFEKFSDLVDDSLLILDSVTKEHPGVPIFVLGESMGGALTLHLSLRLMSKSASDTPHVGHLPAVRGLVLCAPLVRLPPAMLPPAPVLAAMRAVARLAPTAHIPDDSFTDGFLDAFGDREAAAQIKRDPLLTLGRPMLGPMLSIVSATQELAARLEEVQLPLLVLHGPDDCRTEYQYSRELVARARSSDKTLVTMEGMQHMALYDTPDITHRALSEISKWLLARC